MARPRKPKYKLELDNENWLDSKEKDEANKLFNDYLKNNHFEASDIILLRRLIFAIINSKRIEKELTSQFKAGTEDPRRMKVSTALNRAYNESINEIVTIQKQLGLLGDKSKGNPLEFIFNLFRKAKKWREENLGRDIDCPFCKQKIYLMIRTDKYKAIKHPFFGKNKILFNITLWKLYKNNRITKKEFADTLNTSELYIDWLDEQIADKGLDWLKI